jgi:hypothetical protein
MKLRRRVVETHYQSLIDTLYSQAESEAITTVHD